MTRARKTLTLVSRRNDPVAYLREMGSARQHRRSVAVAKEGARVPPGRYETLGKRNLLIDFAGRKPEDNPAHRALADLQAGDEVTLEPMDTEWPYSTGWTRRSDGCPCPRSPPGSSCGGGGRGTGKEGRSTEEAQGGGSVATALVKVPVTTPSAPEQVCGKTGSDRRQENGLQGPERDPRPDGSRPLARSTRRATSAHRRHPDRATGELRAPRQRGAPPRHRCRRSRR